MAEADHLNFHLPMKHLEEYNRIILFRQQRPLPKELYGERHHIVPRSICPLLEKAKDNLIRLTAQEHFLAHYHLYLAYKEELNEPKWAMKMALAFARMKQQLLLCEDLETMSELYASMKQEIANAKSQAQIGRKNPRAVEAMRKARTGSHNTPEANEANRRAHLGNKTWLGKHHSEETKKKMSEIRRRRGLGIGNKNAVGGKGHTGLKWITNGIEERAIPVGQTPPNGWRFGRRKKKSLRTGRTTNRY